MGDEMLTDLGYRVAAKTGAREALALFRRTLPGSILSSSDQTMPEMTGVELAGEILALRADIPIIMCTGFSYRRCRHCGRCGVRAFTMKPLTKKEIQRRSGKCSTDTPVATVPNLVPLVLAVAAHLWDDGHPAPVR